MPTLLKSHHISRICLFIAPIVITFTPLFTSSAQPIRSTAATPTDADIFRSGTFLEPLVPIGGKTASEENIALQKAIDLCANSKDQDDHAAILTFLEKFPKSPWRAALLTNLGLEYRRTGWFLKALSAWEEAWRLSKDETSNMGKGLADRAFAELVELYARLGRKEDVEKLLKEIDGRSLIGPATEKVTSAREGLWKMYNEPGTAFKCGPFALGQIQNVEKNSNVPNQKVLEAQSTDHGTSLKQVYELSKELGLKYQMAKRKPGSKILVPCVVNWKANHYAALVSEDKGRFLSSDPTFGGNIFVTKAALDAEASGYFLVPEGELPEGWRSVSFKEASRVWGMGATTDHDPTGTKCGDDKAKPSCGANCGGGMARYNFHTQLVSLNITDTPVGYTPPVGPDMHFTVTYNQREAGFSANLGTSNFGSKWVCNWFAAIQGQLFPPATPVYAQLAGGGSELFVPTSDTPGSDVTYTPGFQTGATLVLPHDAPPRFERTSPDGSRQVFEFVAHGGLTTLITRSIDPAGNTAHFNYDSNSRLTSVTDALGQATTIQHLSDDPNVLPDFYLIHQITDPFGRSAMFDYDSNKRLWKIHDTIGIVSEFIYATSSDTCGGSPCPSDFIKEMITPYGPTTFSQPLSPLDATSNPGTGNARTIQAVDSTGAIERVEYGHLATDNTMVPATETKLPTVPGVTFYNGVYNYRNSFYWDKKATAMFPPTHSETCNCDVYDYTKAKLTHWLHVNNGSDTTVSNIKEREKQPLENAVYYFYPDQPNTYNGRVFTGSSGFPSMSARVLDDGTTQLWQYSHNNVGKVTQSIDPTGRVTSYKYADNEIDLLAVYQRNPAGISPDPDEENADLIASYAYDPSDPPHVPHSSTDAAGQTTHYFYLPTGQIQYITNPRAETTTYGYGENGNPAGYLTSITSPAFNGSSAITVLDYQLGEGVFAPGNRPHSVKNLPDNYTVTTDYDQLDRPILITYPDGTTQQFSYTDDVRGMTLDLTASTDRDGRWTTRHYDANRNMDSITDPLNQTTFYNWCACGTLDSITDPRGSYAGDPDHTTVFNHDVQGRVYQKLFADNSAINYLYEGQTGPNTVGASSRLKSMTDANGQTTNYQYYIDDNLKQITYTNAVNTTPSVSYGYDDSYNRIAAMADGIGTTYYTYYPASTSTLGAGKLHQVSGPLTNDTITYNYDELSRAVNQDVNGTASSITYDSLGRVDTTANPLGSFSRQYENDVTPRLVTLNYPNGQTANYHYFGNANDRRLQTIGNLDSSSNTLSEFDFTYDPEGQIQALVSPFNSTQFNYDASKRLTGTSQYVPGLHFIQPYGTEYDYDAAGNRLTNLTTTASGTNGSNYTANNLNQLVSASSTLGGPFGGPPSSISITYDANGNMTYDGNNQTYEWDAANRLVAINYLDTGERTEFAYDGLGRMRAIGALGVTDTAASFSMCVEPGVYNPDNVHFGYTLFNSSPLTLPGGIYSLSFQGVDPDNADSTAFLDAVKLNNALVPNGSFEAPNAGAANYYYAFQYDPIDANWTFSPWSGISANGTGFTNGNPNAPDGEQVGLIQFNGTISQMLFVGGGQYTLSFLAAQRGNFNAHSQTIRVNLQPLNIISESVTSGKTFVWCGNRICEERDATGSTTTKRFFAEGEQRIGGDYAGSYYYSRDHLGSVREVTDSSGNLVTQLDYDAWGNEVVVSGNMSVDFGFTGHYFHQPSGLNLAMYRAYNPILARWLNRDPITSPGASLPLVFGASDALDPANIRLLSPLRQVTAAAASGNSMNAALLSAMPSLQLLPAELKPYVYVENDPMRSKDPLGLVTSNCACQDGEWKPVRSDHLSTVPMRGLYPDDLAGCINWVAAKLSYNIQFNCYGCDSNGNGTVDEVCLRQRYIENVQNTNDCKKQYPQ